MSEFDKKLLSRLTLIACVLTSVAITPKTSADPINPIKMAVIAICGFTGAGLLAINLRSLFKGGFKWLLIISGLFSIFLMAGVVTSGNNFNQEFFGAYGRNSGFVTYLSLLLLLIVGATASSAALIRNCIYALVAVGIVVVIYGYMQYIGIEPAGWVSPYSPIIGFLGNPDFNAAFIGFSIVATSAPILNPQVKKGYRILLLIYIFSALYLLKLMVIKQGFLVVAIGFASIVLLLLFSSKFKVLAYALSAMTLASALAISFALFNIGPLAALLYKSSLTARGYYWEAAINMIAIDPLLGVGLDSYGDWYRRARSLDAYEWSRTQYSDSAHSIYLDIASGGGIPLLLAFFALMVLVSLAIFRVVRRSESVDIYFLSLVGVWVGFLAQALISINQIGVSVWGWVISGLIIGYDINSKVPIQSQTQGHIKKSNIHRSRQKSIVLKSKSFPFILAGFVIGCIVGLPTYVAEARYFIELSSSDPGRIQKAAYIWPQSNRHFLQVATTLRDNKANTASARPELKPEEIPDYAILALPVIRDAIKLFPNSFYAFAFLRTLPGMTKEEDLLTQKRMTELDPIAYPK